MAKLQREARISLALDIMKELSSRSKTIFELGSKFQVQNSVIKSICTKLLKAGLLANTGTKTTACFVPPGTIFDENSIRQALDYRVFGVPVEVECRECGIVQNQTMFPNGRRLSDDGRLWKSNECPDCVFEGRRNYEVEKMTHRKCRDCNALLPESRYFKCYTCQPSLPDVSDDEVYEDWGVDDRWGEW